VAVAMGQKAGQGEVATNGPLAGNLLLVKICKIIIIILTLYI
jgi:hypothetical protein